MTTFLRRRRPQQRCRPWRGAQIAAREVWVPRFVLLPVEAQVDRTLLQII